MLTDAGLNEAVVPDGSPLTLKVTVPLNPVPEVTVAGYVVLVPAGTVLEAGVADSEKSATVTVRLAGWIIAPELVVTVNEAT